MFHSVPATELALGTCPQGIYKLRWEREKHRQALQSTGSCSTQGGGAQGWGLGVIFKRGLLRAKQRPEREWPRTNGKRPLLGTEIPPGALTHGGGGQPRAMRGQGAPSSHPPTSPALLKPQEVPCSDFPALPPPVTIASPWAQISPEQLTGHLAMASPAAPFLRQRTRVTYNSKTGGSADTSPLNQAHPLS